MKRVHSQTRDQSSGGPQPSRKQQPLTLSRGRTRSVNKSLNTTLQDSQTAAPAAAGGNMSLAPSKQHSQQRRERDFASASGPFRPRAEKLSRNTKPEQSTTQRQALTLDQLKAIDRGQRASKT